MKLDKIFQILVLKTRNSILFLKKHQPMLCQRSLTNRNGAKWPQFGKS